MSHWFTIKRYMRVCEKTRCIEPFYSKLSASILFILFRRKINVSILNLIKIHQIIFLNKESLLLLNKVYIYVIFPMLA